MTKTEQRAHLSNVRKSINDRQIKEQRLTDKLVDYVMQNKLSGIFCYVSFGSEVSTHAIIKHAINCGKRVYVPHTTDGVMRVKKLLYCADLSTDKYGNLPAHCYGQEAAQADIELSIVPMLGFNKSGYRMGYGGGYYDKFLCGFNGVKIGIAFDEQYMEDIIVEPHDVKLDIILTPNN